jgi:hypothetical protein
LTSNPIDTSDESLLRWHFTDIAEKVYGATRREAELMFRDNHEYILRKLRSDDTRDAQFTRLHWLVEKIGDYTE